MELPQTVDDRPSYRREFEPAPIPRTLASICNAPQMRCTGLQRHERHAGQRQDESHNSYRRDCLLVEKARQNDRGRRIEGTHNTADCQQADATREKEQDICPHVQHSRGHGRYATGAVHDEFSVGERNNGKGDDDGRNLGARQRPEP